MWITYQNCSYYLDKLGYIEKDRLKGNLPFSSEITDPPDECSEADLQRQVL